MIGNYKLQITNYKFIFSLLLSFIIYNLAFIIFPSSVFANHCDTTGSFSSLNQFCDPQTKTLWEDQADCSHTNTGQACPTPATCTYSEDCDAGGGPSSGEHSCTGTNQAGVCKFDSAIDPACTACTAKPPSVAPPVAPPAPPAAATTSNATTNTTTNATPDQESPEEAARRHLSEGLSPGVLQEEVDERPGIIKAVGGFFSGLGTLLNRVVAFYQGSKELQASEVPENQIPNDSDLRQQIGGFLGDSDNKGIYNNTTPDEQLLPPGVQVKVGDFGIPKTEPANAREGGFEDAYFPEWCNKITTGECNIP